jgi:hypothetical protein
VDNGNVRVTETGCRSSLSGETGLIFLGAESLSRENLDSDETVKLGVLGFIDYAHSAFAELI